MPSDKICKTIHQYSKGPISQEDMLKLQEIGEGYRQVKNYVYQRYSGIKSLPRLYPGYTIQNEMTESGLRAQLGLPSVYFYLAVFDALGDIKTQWSMVKNGVLAAVNSNEGLTPEERHYLRFVLKVSGCFENILNGKEVVIPTAMKGQYENILSEMEATVFDRPMNETSAVSDMETVSGNKAASHPETAAGGAVAHREKLNRYLCRQVRKRLHKLHTDKANGFAIAERAYRYGKCGGQQGIFLSTREARKRVFVPLTDENEYQKQLYVKLKPEKNTVEIDIPVETRIRTHEDYVNELGLSPGMWQMLTTDRGKVYGARFGELHRELVEYMSDANRIYRRERRNNPGREKYRARKARLDAGLETYVNQELNRMLAEEKPRIIYIPKLSRNVKNSNKHRSRQGRNPYKKINYSVNVWRRGFLMERLEQKCKENSIELVEVIGQGISTECSACGAEGKYRDDRFRCENCGYEADKKINAARNAMKRGKEGQRINKTYVPSKEVIQ